MFKRISVLGPVIAGALFCGPVLADTDGERAALARLITALDQIEPLIVEAQSQADINAPVFVRYDLLRADLLTVRSGIVRHLNDARRHPAVIEPLSGDYRHRSSADQLSAESR